MPPGSDQKNATPLGIKKIGQSRLEITWQDGHISHYAAHDLRQRCPCAACVDEWTGERLLAPESIPGDLKIMGIEIVGQYALNFNWSDGHRTGIYSFPRLRTLCPCDRCQERSATDASR